VGDMVNLTLPSAICVPQLSALGVTILPAPSLGGSNPFLVM
jgi:hypothetical protein